MKNAWQKIWGIGLACSALLLCNSQAFSALTALPRHLTLVPGQAESLTLDFPFMAEAQDQSILKTTERSGNQFQIQTLQAGNTQVDISLLGWIPLRSISVQVLQEDWLIVGGQSIGVTMESQGVLVVNFSAVVCEDGTSHMPGREAGIKAGDVIVSVDGQPVNTAEELSDMIHQSRGSRMSLLILREENTMELQAEAAWDQGEQNYQLGLWVRDATAGVGTVTYYDSKTRRFGALGHGVVDASTGVLFPMADGNVYAADIIHVIPGKSGNPGELQGSFDSCGKAAGRLLLNTHLGIFGVMDSPVQGTPVRIATHDQVSLGKAEILSTLSGMTVKSYEVAIVRLYPQNMATGKGIVLRVVDEELLAKSGGIVQGMSGSPILQNGMLVGAVTHVFINDPTMGHGVFIEWMLENTREMNAEREAG